MKQYLLLSVLCLLTLAHFSDSDVTIYTTHDFDTQIKDQKNFHLLLEYNTLELAQITAYKLTAEALKGFVTVVALHNTDVSTPTLNVYSNGQPILYEGDWEAQDIANFAFDKIRDYAFKRVGKVPKKEGEKAPEEPKFDESDVIVLTDENFNEKIMNSKEPWFVEFYAPWCGHCKKLAPEWAKLATTLKGEINVAKIDASEQTKYKDTYNVKGFPTLVFFGAGDKIEGDATPFDGAREYESLLTWARETNKKLKPMFFEHLVSQQQFNENCLSTNGICLIAFVPHIYDCDQECRDNYLSAYRETVKPLKSKPLVHFWSQGGDQYDFEEALQISGVGYPSLLAVSPKKQLYSKLRGSFTKDNVSKFIDNLLKGKEQVYQYRSLAQIEEIKE